MKDLFLRFCRWALPLLGITGVVSCEIFAPVMYGSPPVEYGVPTMDYRVTGTVTDSQTGEPVKGIKVQSESLDAPDPVITSETGEFVYEDRWYPHKRHNNHHPDKEYLLVDCVLYLNSLFDMKRYNVLILDLPGFGEREEIINL